MYTIVYNMSIILKKMFNNQTSYKFLCKFKTVSNVNISSSHSMFSHYFMWWAFNAYHCSNSDMYWLIRRKLILNSCCLRFVFANITIYSKLCNRWNQWYDTNHMKNRIALTKSVLFHYACLRLYTMYGTK